MSQQIYHLLSGAWPLVAESRRLRSVTPEGMDELWSAGWRHFGADFFRASLMTDGAYLKRQIPLRIRVGSFRHSRSQRRTHRKNADLRTVFTAANPGCAEENLFNLHKLRFEKNVPETLEDFLGSGPAEYPCSYQQLSVYLKDQLIAVSFMALGRRSCSSIYAAFAPEFSRRRLGIYTLLSELEFARGHDMKFHYIGYATMEPSCYDYKKQFAALEYFDWEGRWLSGEGFSELDEC